MKSSIRIKLRGVRWVLKFMPPHVFQMTKIRGKRHRICGTIDWDTHEMWIRNNMEPLLTLDTILHEMDHACHPDVEEDVINGAATDRARVLWRLGYRKDAP